MHKLFINNKLSDKDRRPTEPWLVIHFTEEGLVEAVPCIWWLEDKTECYWPPSEWASSTVADCIKHSKKPEKNWSTWPGIILGRYDDLATAKRKANKARDTDNLSSNCDQIQDRYRGRRAKNRTVPTHRLSDIESTASESENEPIQNAYPSTSKLGAQRKGLKSIVQNPLVKEKDVATDINRNKTHDEGFQEAVNRELNSIQLKLNDIIESVSLLTKTKRFQNEPLIAVNEVPDIIHAFPVNEKSLEEMECWLRDNAENKKILAQELSRIGGSTVKELTRRIMYRVFTNEVGLLYSWEGAKKKRPFKKLAIASTILSAVRISRTTSESNEAEVISFIKAWLVRCKDRLNNRTRADGEEVEDRARESADEEERVRNTSNKTRIDRAVDEARFALEEIRVRDKRIERIRVRLDGKVRDTAEEITKKIDIRAKNTAEVGVVNTFKDRDVHPKEKVRDKSEDTAKDTTKERVRVRPKESEDDKPKEKGAKKSEEQSDYGGGAEDENITDGSDESSEGENMKKN